MHPLLLLQAMSNQDTPLDASPQKAYSGIVPQDHVQVLPQIQHVVR